MENSSNIINKLLQKRWATHTLFWVAMFAIPVAQRNVSGGDLYPVIISYAVILPSQMIFAYFLTYYLVPHLIKQRKYLQFLVYSVVTVYFLGVLARILTIYVAEPLFVKDLTQESILEIFTDPGYLFIVYVPSVCFIPILMASIKVIKDTYKEREKIETLKQEKTKAELNFLKAQIHPHFLLNTLNNLYALTLKKSDKAPETVIKLSDMLVYTLYQCEEKYVPLESEIKLLKNYISLEQLRYGDNLKISFKEKVTDKNVFIAPLILLSIVENAFKHGASGETEDAEIAITIEQSDDSFNFEVTNSKSGIMQIDHTDHTKGIGTENVKKQLELVYPQRYIFEVTENEKSYKVLLKLDLTKE